MFLGLILFQIVISVHSQEESSAISTVFVKQSGKDENSGLAIDQEKQSLKVAYSLLSGETEHNIKIISDTDPFTAEAVVFDKKPALTIEGWKSDGRGNTEVAIDCDVNPGSDLFKCEGTVEFKFLAFHFPTSLEKENQDFSIYSLIKGDKASLSIRNCRFVRPEAREKSIDINLVCTTRGLLTLESVECKDAENTLLSSKVPFKILDALIVSLSNISMDKIEISGDSVIKIISSANVESEITLNRSTFSELKSYGAALNIATTNDKSTFTVGNGGVTTFSLCSCSDFHSSGGIYLQMPTIMSATQLKWPQDGRKLIFDRCSAGEGESKRNIGLFIRMINDSLFEDIAASMKNSFASDFNRRDNRWNVVGFDNSDQNECDFVFKYFDPLPPRPENMQKAFVKNGGKGNGINFESAMYSLKDAYDYLDKSEKCFIDIVNTEDPIRAEAISFDVDNGITIEGVNSDGNGNVEMAIDCDVSALSTLFMCEREVEFKYLALNIPTSEKKWDYLIFGNEMSTSLTISNIRFVRVGRQSQEGGIASNNHEDDFAVGSLVSVLGGKVSVKTVTCTDEKNTVSFLLSPFSFLGASEVSLNGVEIGKVKVKGGAAISINDGIETTSKVSIEGLDIKDSNSEMGNTAGLQIVLFSEESTVAIGRGSKCSFKSCSAPEGKAGAMLIRMPKATSNLQLPTANNLEIDSSNTAGSKTTSLFILAPDFEEFCKQEDAFEFANDYDDSTAGWIVGAKDEESEPEDVCEKYVKVRQDRIAEQNRKQKEKKRRIIVAVVVPIVVVVVVVVVVVIVVVVIIKKKKAKYNTDVSKEQEMSTQE
ncbi:uncharacterized protein MONOS_4005 [Monocercomonoides exilis]|uniref:uncharacterized protein n=1 Tax=Monocercomonoides exilis TaxID=2049356 RepID=UPI00355A27D7|nr:hypothetical protein MONOS_4005 [Monocercomonoides exilis]|eukprot:MONOS_4005.1-p1 / transcript=MONOS_4005.1 / gene=MONOS_4005 / organism=Monocercomonoides_exilis_PA203 / gene_product=unspecified product / transcript_product=unspecified product / location=Mono_scaffold00100:120387-122855(-) / protein_length=823 / sequence_SO=supercontig / SO=protein_coding / is_pseudo=false